jgi:hypothetical protein
MVYRGIPVEQVRQQFDILKGENPVVPKVKRKLRIPAVESKNT